ncbi:unnamed protein product [Brugia pahangi]|uniref:Ovule protein n=1 Tax=Brugia pahangi TaxID=6280 RepID=A0A0N4TLC8_BRUPA|nr:unnamed protein product [Brugia pahangi]
MPPRTPRKEQGGCHLSRQRTNEPSSSPHYHKPDFKRVVSKKRSFIPLHPSSTTQFLLHSF